MWVLMLNDMRSPKIEYLTPVARAETKEELNEFLIKETVEPYSDNNWGKNFRAGGPLEWYNPPYDDRSTFRNIGTLEDHLQKTRDWWDRVVLSIPST